MKARWWKRALGYTLGLLVVAFLVLAHFNPGAALDVVRPLLGDWADQTLPKEFFWIFPAGAAAAFVLLVAVVFRKKDQDPNA